MHSGSINRLKIFTLNRQRFQDCTRSLCITEVVEKKNLPCVPCDKPCVCDPGIQGGQPQKWDTVTQTDLLDN